VRRLRSIAWPATAATHPEERRRGSWFQ
jgi:hypothetical protein